ncbi:MAG: hypothetical protein QG602_853 [Verrucomicrobiota bacterium]|nr:hypothetical protein [Verrucomicrobiota bacterium]
MARWSGEAKSIMRRRTSLTAELAIPGEPELSAAMSRVLTNSARVSSLIAMYNLLRSRDGEKRGRSQIHRTDMLRAAIVLLHATLEDGLRSLLRFRIKRCKETFDAIALAGINDHGRPEKFLLGELYRFQGKTVDEIWNTSLEAHLARQSFNDTADIAKAISQIGIDSNLLKPLLKPLSELVSRRHHIVHNADVNENKGKAGHQFTRSISRTEVAELNKTVMTFFSVIAMQIIDQRKKPDLKTIGGG